MLKRFYIFFFLLNSLAFNAQNIEVKSSIDTNFLLIGEQTKIHLKVNYQLDGKNPSIQFPHIYDTLNQFVEIVYTSPIDTSYPDKNDLAIVEQSQSITITSFDSGYYYLPAFDFVINNDTISTTEELYLDVKPMLVDTTKAIFDIKKPLEEPFSLIDWLKEYWIWIVATLVLIIIIIIAIKYLKNKPKKVVEELKPDVPIHVIALQQLDELKKKQLWQNGKIKDYHIKISEILRNYIEHRYQFNALESTTNEIMQALRFETINPNILSNLQKILELTDLIKFAKGSASPQENESMMIKSIEFINETKLTVATTENKDDNVE